MARIAPSSVKGTRDYLPRDLVRRNRVFGLLRETFERYGYEPLETPAVENTRVLEGKYGEEGERLLFRVLKRGNDLEAAVRALDASPDVPRDVGELSRRLADMALRYDLTVPFARVIAAHQNDIVFPFRRYQMQPVWRADRPQRGRYREFYQCDVDCVGSHSITVEAEMLAMVSEVFDRLGFSDYTIRINHRALLSALMAGVGVVEQQRVAALVAIDKLDKIGAEGVREELTQAGIAPAVSIALLGALTISGTPREMLAALEDTVGASEDGAHALRDLGELLGHLEALGVALTRYTLDIATVRGLAYYTAIICEFNVTGAAIGSLGGGGRYDKLIGQFLGRDLPCVGISFGIDRIFTAMDLLGLWADDATTATQVLVTHFSAETIPAALALARVLRDAGLRTEVYAEARDIGPQLAFASKKGIPVACILGPDEIARGEVTLRDMRTRAQRAVPLATAAAEMRLLLATSARTAAGALAIGEEC